MLLCMRTTINLEDSLLHRAKEEAARRKRTLTSLVEDALREALNRPGRKGSRSRVRLPVSEQPPGILPGVDLGDSAALLELMEEDNGAARR